jgi:hypothetical protein
MNASALPLFSATSFENVSLFVLFSFGLAALSSLYLLKETLSNSPISSRNPLKGKTSREDSTQSQSKERVQASARQHTTSSSSSASFISSLQSMLATTIPRPVPIPDTITTAPRTVSVSMGHPSAESASRTETPTETPKPAKQPFDAYLVLDVEATCLEGTDFNWPNEIIVRCILLVCLF